MYEMGEKLKKLRKERKLSQDMVAKKMNLSKSAVSGYETFSKLPSLPVLIQLASFYNVSTDYLLGIDNKEYVNIDKLTEQQKTLIKCLVNELGSEK